MSDLPVSLEKHVTLYFSLHLKKLFWEKLILLSTKSRNNHEVYEMLFGELTSLLYVFSFQMYENEANNIYPDLRRPLPKILQSGFM